MSDDDAGDDEEGRRLRFCRNCRWWGRKKAWAATAPCRRHPPPRMATNQRGSWPITMSNDWCGDHSEERHG